MTTSRLTRAWRFARLLAHLFAGLAEVALVFPSRDAAGRAATIRRWSRRLCDILAVRIDIHGNVPDAVLHNAVLVANHVSWLDIFVLNSVTALRFVAKVEIRRWPVIGWFCQRVGTLFITREKRVDTHRVNKQIARALAEGDCIAVFPEGSTTDGYDVIPFNASLLQPAVDASARVLPVALRYYDARHTRSDAASYVGEMSLLGSLKQILTHPALTVRLDFLPVLATGNHHRRQLARTAHAVIADVVLSDSPIAAPTDHHRTIAVPCDDVTV